MSFPQGINFIANEEYRSGEDATDFNDQSFNSNYPEVSPQGNNVGWEGDMEEAEQNHNDASGVDVRLAGNHYDDAAGPIDYRIDLSGSGDWDVELALGDHEFPAATEVWIYDTSTERLHVAGAEIDTDTHEVADAEGTITNEADWPSGQVPVTVSMTTTIFRCRVGSSDFCGIEHLSVTLAADPLTRDQHAFRAFEDDANEASSTALAAEDIDAEAGENDSVQGRIGVQYVENPPAEAMQWEYKEDGDAAAEWRKMT